MAESDLAEIVAASLASATEAVITMNDDHEKLVRIKAEAPHLYSESVHVTSLATHIQGIYSNLESTLERVVLRYGDRIPDSARWHQALLQAAAAPGNSRPPIISSELLPELHELLAFRHSMRVNYGNKLDGRIFPNRERASLVVEVLGRELIAFLAAVPEPGRTPKR